MNIRKNIKSISIIGLMALGIIGFGVHYFANQSKRELEKQILAMDGMNINLEFDNAEAFYRGVDSLYTPRLVKKLILFVDSASCSGCFLSHLVSYFEINDSLGAHNAEMLVVLHPQNDKLDEIRKLLRHEQFPFWCIMDKEREFVRQNPGIPDNQILHTFALNESNQIVLVGDPTRNDKIKELFSREILK